MLVWDTLYGFDENLQPQRQMVEGEEVSQDGKTWTFKLREGLKFHDGEPVRSRDVVASLSISGSTWRMDEATRVATVEPLLRAAREISLALGWSGDEPD